MGSDAYCPGDSKAIQRGTPTSRLLPHAQQSRQNSGRSRKYPHLMIETRWFISVEGAAPLKRRKVKKRDARNYQDLQGGI